VPIDKIPDALGHVPVFQIASAAPRAPAELAGDVFRHIA
jgi:hypothetical protein